MKGGDNFIYTDVEENKKEYSLPDLPEGYWIVGAFINEKNDGGNK